jgi:hypothetical protein
MILYPKPVQATVDFIMPAFAVVVDNTVRAMFFYLEDAKKYAAMFPDSSQVLAVTDDPPAGP